MVRRADALAPPRYRTDTEAGLKARFYVRALCITSVFAGSMTVVYVPSGLWGQVALNALVAVVSVALILRLRHGGDLDRLVPWALGVPSLAFAAGSLAQTPFDVSSVFFLAVTPLIASFVSGSGAALRWLFAMTVLGALMLYAGFHGYVLPQVDTSPQTTTLTNFGFLMALVAVIGIGMHELRAKAYAAVDLASRAKSAFLANISHEIRTPMNGVLGLTEVMLREPLTGAQRERLEMMQRSGQVLVTLIDDLLDLARIEAGRFALSARPTSLRLMLDDVKQLFSGNARSKGLELHLELSGDVPAWVSTDATRLRQVLFNLVSNAVKFTSQGQVRVRVGPAPAQPGFIAFHVEDTGIGLSAATARRLFVAFEQADSSTTRRYGGSGLGLAISRSLVELLGGRLEVDSVEGSGSDFHFALPLTATEAPPLPLEPAPEPVALNRALHVLVVDDNPINLKVASSFVERAGHRVTTAVNGAQALDAATHTTFDVILMDCHMPEMDGLEATRRIRALPQGARVPILALTASTFPEDIAACLAAGMNECLAKPVSMQTLNASLARLFGGQASGAAGADNHSAARV